MGQSPKWLQMMMTNPFVELKSYICLWVRKCWWSIKIVNTYFSCIVCFQLYGWCIPPWDLSLMDLDRNLRVGQDPCARRKHLGFRVPMHFLHLGTVPLTWKPGSLDPAPAPDQYGLPVQNGEIFIVSMSLSVWSFTISGRPTRIKSCWQISGCSFDYQIFSVGK